MPAWSNEVRAATTNARDAWIGDHMNVSAAACPMLPPQHTNEPTPVPASPVPANKR